MFRVFWLAALFIMALFIGTALAQNSRIRDAQLDLHSLGYAVGAVDGVMGSRTRAEIQKFQSDNGYRATGELDDRTFAVLRERASRPHSQPNSAVATQSAALNQLSSSQPVTPTSSSRPAVSHSGPEGATVWLLVVGGVVLFLVLRRRKLAAPRPAGAPLRTPISDAPPERSVYSRSSQPDRARWIAPGEVISIRGVSIARGCIYVGDRLTTPSGYWNENCLINPSLPVDRAASGEPSPPILPYYPSYERIPAQCRWDYLQWLASARDNPASNIGYVFLYFYGLERRLMLDRHPEERPSLLQEVGRLRVAYASNGSFHRYSQTLLEAALLFDSDAKFYEQEPHLTTRFSGELPLSVRAAIGQLLHEGRRVPGRWALAWVLGHPETRLPTAARRAFAEFSALFLSRFQTEFPQGLSFEAPKRKLSARYRAASGTFEVDLNGDFRHWPDIRDITKPLGPLRKIADQCAADLGAFSRYIAKNAELRTSIQAAALLPRDLFGKTGAKELKAVEAKLANIVNGERTRITVQELIHTLGFTLESGKLGRRDRMLIGETLERLGFGVDPDLRVSSIGARLDRSLVIFRLPTHSESPSIYSGAYEAGLLLVSLAATVILADGSGSAAEERRLIEQVDGLRDLTESERARLKAHAVWLLGEPPSISQLRDSIRGLPEASRKRLAELVIPVAAAQGAVGPQVVKAIERVYRVLGIAIDAVHSDLHAFQTERPVDDDPPVVIKGDGHSERGHRIPERGAAEDAPIALDHAKIARIQSDTREAAALLSSIFTNEDDRVDEPARVEVVEGGDQSHPLDGLDSAHAALVHEVASRESWPRGDFEQLARSHNLLPNGAIEVINEWSFDHVNDVLIEDGDPITIHIEYIKALEIV